MSAARSGPDRVAAVFPDSGMTLSRAELDREANRAAQAFRALGLQRGDCVALSITNRPEFLATMLGAKRSGLIYVLLSTKLSGKDAAYILTDSGAALGIFSAGSFALEDCASLAGAGARLFGIDAGPDLTDWTALAATMPDHAPEDMSSGAVMLYSSGTTGRPKGVRKPLPNTHPDAPDPSSTPIIKGYGVGEDSCFYCPCPLYHSAPHRFINAALEAGAQVVLPQRFDASAALEHLEKWQCTHSLWVPTMFHRLLKLPQAERDGRDLSHQRHAFHGAAACPVHVKRAMIEWWGPIIDEYYSGSEGIGSATISSAEWLAHPGSVGRPMGCKAHILDENGVELPAGQTGDIYFEADVAFEYWKDPAKTRESSNAHGWRTFGDVGHVDEDGYLYLTDRRHFTIISGGVNIYPQEIEDALLEHDGVRDAAVIGVPHEDLGQIAIGVVQPAEGVADRDQLAADLLAHARARLGPVKTPKRIEFLASLPRHETGKLYKGELIARYSGKN